MAVGIVSSSLFKATRQANQDIPEVFSAVNSGGVLKYFGSPQSVPAAFSAGDWTLTDGALTTDLDVTILSLPDSGNSPITDILYRIDGGSWVSSGGVESFNIAGLTTSVSVDIELMAVNKIGASIAGDLKSETPT